jgi:eukaryotic-like serine/threonine-protein kinase
VLQRDPARARARVTALVLVPLALGAGGVGYYQAINGGRARCAGGEEKIDLVWSASQREAVRAAFEATGSGFAQDVWRVAERAIDHHADAWKAAYVDACEATHVRGEQSAELLDLRMHCLERAREDLSALIDVFARADEAIVRHAVEAIAKLGSVARCTDVVTLRAEGRPSDPALREAVDALDADLARARGLDHAGHGSQALEAAASILERAEALDYPPLEGRVAFAMATAYSSLGDEKNAELMLRRTARLAERVGLDMQRARALIQLGYLIGYRRADYEVGRWYLSLARAILDRLGEEGVILAEVYSNEAVIEAATGRPDEALVLLHEALRIRRRIEGHERVDVAVVLSNIGGAHFEKGEYAKALSYYQEVHDLRVEVFGETHPIICDSFENLGNVLHAMGRSEEALDHHRQGRAVCEKIGVGGLGAAQRLNNEATVLLGLSRPQEAIELYRQALAICESQPRHPTRGIILANLGEALLAGGEVDQAFTLYEESLEIIEEALGRDQVYWAVARAGMGHALLELGRTAEAREALQDAVVLFERVTADPQMLAEVEFHLARALVEESSDADTIERAIALVRRARETFQRTGDRGRKLAAASQVWLEAHAARSR